MEEIIKMKNDKGSRMKKRITINKQEKQTKKREKLNHFRTTI